MMRRKDSPSQRRRQRCEQRVRELDLPERTRLTLQQVIDRVSHRRGRAIRLVPMEITAAVEGLWVSSSDEDYIVVESRLTPVHRHQVALHELGHIICGHEGTPESIVDTSRALLPALDPGHVRRVLGREHADSDAELEAELVGSLLGQRIASWTSTRRYDVPPRARELAARLSALMEHREPGPS
ncbi:ImmA/IrrE family metallo-endopeptidase [Haloechinothrix sp. LS1_15]|uniref:ImmA/IrrE family metallo-endopeptidase n=1 Tax=Haloechinothrix sp. LS1_15 TaxID=2652248 RepID=UPI002944B561|nr:ImmA/IrrE family metallo-endopeptidase [Haloechinothrix sp. LS1_15]MDV6011927.1 ImmA/IrrE family metallo-endopeptidase [Haloechinothrix sp. LS1_15]